MAPGQPIEHSLPAVVDFRSDTVTKPSSAMRKAMLEAEVGDDVYGEDPMVNRLQAYAAELVNKEAAIFVPTGTMGNLTSMLAHSTQRGAEVLVGDESHIYHYEAGGAAACGGLVWNVIQTNKKGELPIEQLERAHRNRPDDAHCPRPALVAIENTHNRCGGTVLSPEYMASLKAWADSKGIPVHLDGARVFNAAAALGVPVSHITQHVTTISFCLSKGLGCPVGSIVAGPADFIHRVHRVRKMLGGGMRQVGVLAAPGLIALKEGPSQLLLDHQHAQQIATALSTCRGVQLDLDLVHSNIVVFHLLSESGFTPEKLVHTLEGRGVAMSCFKDGVRAVTHRDVTGVMVERAIAVIKEVLGGKQ